MRELSQYAILHQLTATRINGTEAARQLRLTTRQVRRLKRKVERQGPQGLAHASRGKRSNRRLATRAVNYSRASLTVAQESGAKSSNKKQAAGAQDEIKKLEEERNRAILHADTAALDRMTSDDYTLINQRGDLIKKAQILDGFKSGAIKFDSRELSDLNVRVYGNAAVVTGRVTQKSMENGKDTSGENRFTRVYVKEKGRWVSVAQQATPIAEQ